MIDNFHLCLGMRENDTDILGLLEIISGVKFLAKFIPGDHGVWHFWGVFWL